jgi:hypothetical protein
VTDIDIYADNMKPITFIDSVTVKVVMPAMKPSESQEGMPVAWALLNVELAHSDPCLVDVKRWYWFGLHSNNTVVGTIEEIHKHQKARDEVYSWLTEWEFIELRQIGPEDSEYFATDKLLEVINVTRLSS